MSVAKRRDKRQRHRDRERDRHRETQREEEAARRREKEGNSATRYVRSLVSSRRKGQKKSSNLVKTESEQESKKVYMSVERVSERQESLNIFPSLFFRLLFSLSPLVRFRFRQQQQSAC